MFIIADQYFTIETPTMKTSTYAAAGSVVESLITADVGDRGTVNPIVSAMSTFDGSEEPPVMAAATALTDAIDNGDTVVVLTGFPIPPGMIHETDGPAGAVSLARAIDIGLGANVVLACEPNATEICSATARAGGLHVGDRTVAFEHDRAISVEPYPTELADAKTYTDELLDLDPAAVVAVEKAGPNERGFYHNLSGRDISEHTAKIEPLYDRLDDCLTVAVGDGGNEVGMGAVASEIREHIPYGDQCQCDCESGIACAVTTDTLVPAAVSNWGAHGIVACLSVVLGRALLHDPEIERRMLIEGCSSGAIDGITGGTTGKCDGLPPESHAAMVRLLGETAASFGTDPQ